MKRYISSLVNNEIVRYIVIGGCTTLVNFVVFGVLCYGTPMGNTDLGITVSNTISIICAILFAYVTNKTIVFRSKSKSVTHMLTELTKFFGARMSTMLLEIGGVFLIASVLKQDEMLAKLCTQVLVLIGNYFISKYLVFGQKKEEKQADE